jgi:hypothetical protein
MSEFFRHLDNPECVGTKRSWDFSILSRDYTPTFIVPGLEGHLSGTVDRVRLANCTHYDPPSNSYICPYCMQTFESFRMLDEHLSLPFHDVKPYFCPNLGCDTRFSTFGGLCHHVERTSPCMENIENDIYSMAGLRACLLDLGGQLLF